MGIGKRTNVPPGKIPKGWGSAKLRCGCVVRQLRPLPSTAFGGGVDLLGVILPLSLSRAPFPSPSLSLFLCLLSLHEPPLGGCPWKENQGNCTIPDYLSCPAEQERNNLEGFEDVCLKMAQVQVRIRSGLSRPESTHNTVLCEPLSRRVPVEGERRQLHHP